MIDKDYFSIPINEYKSNIKLVYSNMCKTTTKYCVNLSKYTDR